MGLIKIQTIVSDTYTTTQNLDVLSNNSSLIEYYDNQAITYGKKITYITEEIKNVISLEFLGSNKHISFIKYDSTIIEKNGENL